MEESLPDQNDVLKAIREAEASFSLSGLNALEIEHYRQSKVRILQGQIGFEEAVRLAVEHHTDLGRSPAPFPAGPRGEHPGDDPYCYPGTDVPINKLGIRDKRALAIAETEIGTLRYAEQVLAGSGEPARMSSKPLASPDAQPAKPADDLADDPDYAACVQKLIEASREGYPYRMSRSSKGKAQI